MTVKSHEAADHNQLLYEPLTSAIKRASALIAPTWPLKTAISVNPLADATHLSFEEAISNYCSGAQGAQFPSHRPYIKQINAHLIKWIAPFVDSGQLALPLPDRHLGFYGCWRSLCQFDPTLPATYTPPAHPHEGLLVALEALGIKEEKWAPFFEFHLLQLPGWSGCAKWHAQNESSGLNLTEFLAVRLTIAAQVLQPPPKELPTPVTLSSCAIINHVQKAERPYKELLKKQLLSMQISPPNRGQADIQWVFCIDIRSEPMRRKIEALGGNETFGTAGFFNLPIQLRSSCKEQVHHSAPVTVPSYHEVSLKPCIPTKRPMQWRSIHKLYIKVQSSFVSPFALAESMGPLAGVAMILRTFGSNLIKTLREKVHFDVPVAPRLDPATAPLKTRAKWAIGALKGMGLTRGFGRAVVICGHRATTANNPHHSSLQCGACGGNPGGANAQLLCEILNDRNTREELAKAQITIPETTRFLPAEHNTTTDTITLLSTSSCNASDKALRKQIDTLCQQLSQKDSQHLCRSADWAQVRPEWGLARNAAMLIGRRTLSEKLDLQGRVFLHSYDPEIDPEGETLSEILSGPLLVAQWINSQYLFSTVAPTQFGGGNKVVNQVVGKMGVMQGCHSDLLQGLPHQSVFASDDTPYHEPIRLYVIIEAPRTLLDILLTRHQTFRQLVDNRWIHLHVIDSDTKELMSYDTKRGWISL